MKELRRWNSPYLLQSNYSQDQLDNSKYIPFFIFSTETYADISVLMEKIVDFYLENNTPAEKLFDFICINKKCLIMNYRKNYLFTHNEGFDGIADANYQEDSLAAFLLWHNILHGAEARMGEPILKHYFNNDLKTLKVYNDLNEKLKMIDKV